MSLRERLLRRRPRGGAGDDSASEATGSAPEDQPITGYDRLDDKEVGGRLHTLSQVELTAVESYERSHRGRPAVLNKLRYMRTSEPLPGYDTLAPEQVVESLARADTGTVKAVRDYERKFRGRQRLLDEASRVLPTSAPSAQETRAREESAARVSEGIAGRAKTADQVASHRPMPPAEGE